MEILLVVAILAISVAVIVPQFARSFRGARLRQSSRTVQMMHRQAKARAVLDQTHAALFFDAIKGTVELVVLEDKRELRDAFFGDETPEEEDGESVATHTELLQSLEEGVTIEDFRGGAEINDLFYVRYYPGGMCQEWSLRLRDEDGFAIRISVNPVTGQISSESES